jgi:glycosyltransferase involved in cell wall biosynthesis
MRLAMRPASRVVACWTAGEAALRTVLPDERVGLVDNGVPVETAVLHDVDNDPPRVLYVGLLTPRKGVLDLLAASRRLRERGTAHELCLIGGTPDEGPEAEAEVRAALDDHVRLLGTRAPEQMPAELAAGDVLCLPSWWEAMPLSVLEGMAAGLPVVATDVGDVSRAIADGVTGYVVPVRNADKLADALEPLLLDAGLRRRMGAAGRARVTEMFSSEVTARAVSHLYAELTSAAR